MNSVNLQVKQVGKFINRSRGRSEGSSFNSYYPKIGEGATFFPGFRHLPSILPLVLSAKQGSIEYRF